MTTNDQTQGIVRSLKHESNVLRGNPLGDPHVREVIVYTPPGYDASDERYPSVYCLSGFTSRSKGYLNDSPLRPDLAARMDMLIAAGKIRPMIVVLPDCFTYYGGSQYINSTATGNYEDYLTREIVPFVDANFRTVPEAGARASMGISSGGYGSLVLGLRHADIFGLICSHAGDAYFEYSLMGDFAKSFRIIKGDPMGFMERFWAEEKKASSDFAALNTIGMAACYSPNGSEIDMPFDLETGELREEVWARWLEHDPVRLVEKYVENLKSLRLLYLDAGTRDDFALDIGARVMSAKLRKFGIPHVHEEFDDGHHGIVYRFNRSLELISENAGS